MSHLINGMETERPKRMHPDMSHWRQLRQTVFARFGGFCAACPSPADDLHHRHYDRFGCEEEGDVVPLCRDCHEAITSRLRAARYAERAKPAPAVEPVERAPRPVPRKAVTPTPVIGGLPVDRPALPSPGLTRF